MNEDTFWVRETLIIYSLSRLTYMQTTPRNTNWGLIQTQDLLHVDSQANNLEEERDFDKERLLIHLAIYSARPEIKAIGYSQPPHGLAFSHQGALLKPLTQDSCAFYKVNRLLCLVSLT